MSRFFKALLICGLVFVALAGISYNNPSQSAQLNLPKSDEYVGSDTCKDCHEDQFKNFSHTSHAQLTKLAS